MTFTVPSNGFAQPVVLTDSSGNTVGSNGAIVSSPEPSTIGTQSSVASSATVVTLKASNPLRNGLTVYNDSSSVLYLLLGSGASSTNYTVQLGQGSYYEIPYAYTGIVTGIWASATGNARVTELA